MSNRPQVAASFDFTCGIYADCNGRDVLDEIVEVMMLIACGNAVASVLIAVHIRPM